MAFFPPNGEFEVGRASGWEGWVDGRLAVRVDVVVAAAGRPAVPKKNTLEPSDFVKGFVAVV